MAIPPSSTNYVTSGLDLYIDHWCEVFLAFFSEYKIQSNQYFRLTLKNVILLTNQWFPHPYI